MDTQTDQPFPFVDKDGQSNINHSIFRQLIRNSFDMIVLIDADGVQRYVSESCRRILGYSPEELVPISVIDDMIHPDDKDLVRSGLQDIIFNRANGGAQYRHKHKNGEWIYLEAFGLNQLDNPLIQSVILNVRDITERKQTEEALHKREQQLRKLNATKDRLFSIIGHDLRSPFNAILGFSELLIDKNEQDDADSIISYAQMIHHAALKANELLDNLLTWSKSQAGHIIFEPCRIPLKQHINQIFELFRDLSVQKNISLHQDISDDLFVLADRSMLDTIVRNLVSNSIKYTNSGGEIIVSATENDTNWAITVRDTGIGLSDTVLKNLFRIEHTKSKKGTWNEIGTGLGLHLCKEFVERHHGTIGAKQLPNGSQFTFSLPKNTRHSQN